MSTFYVYVDWTLETTPRAFYVGKGNQSRIKYIPRNKHHVNVANKHGQRREIVFSSSDQDECLKREIELIAELRTFVYDPHYNGVGCNYTQGGEGSRGAKRSPETKQKLSDRRVKLLETGWRPTLSDEVKARLHVKAIEREAQKREQGWHPSEETRKKLSEAQKKRPPRNEETRRKLSEAAKQREARRRELGIRPSEETRKKMSESQRRRHHPHLELPQSPQATHPC